MSEDGVTNPVSVTPPAPPAKKTRKPRTPKVKPPRKPRIGLGPIVLMEESSDGLAMIGQQPTVAIANDISKVQKWAETIPELEGLVMKPVRFYNCELKVDRTVAYRASLRIPTAVAASTAAV